MKWKNRSKQLALFKTKYRNSRYKVPFPNLREADDRKLAPCTNGFGQGFAPAPKPKPPTNHIVDTLHKQGPMVLSRSELPWAGGKKP